MKKAILFLAVLAVFCAAGAEVCLISSGRSRYKIVYADTELFPFHNRYSSGTAETFQKILRHATGVRLPVVPESRFDGKGKAFFIGATRALRTAGLAPERYERWEHRIDVKDQNIYLHGMDWRNSKSPEAGYRQYYVFGSRKAMLTFSEKFLNAVFAGTPNVCDGVPKIKKLSIPENYSFKRTPAIEYNLTGRRTLDYDVANNGFYAPWYGTYGGHNHNVALNVAKYFKTHPEYYALSNGKRTPGPRVQLCLSNKQVQELIYKEVLDHLDQGFEMVQLAQSDGFSPCECLECQNLFGLVPKVSPKEKLAYRSSPVWGEKLWILHRSFAERLLKDRPGKKVCIIAYGPTRRPPESFKEFPSNTVIELAPYSEEILKSWQSHKVPGGFVVYLYNWGYYNPAGFTPKRSWDFCKKQIISFLNNNVKGIYCCGFGENHGLEGPTYYIWLKLTEDPGQDVKVLLNRFCRNIFPAAVKEMEAFYTLLDSRLQLEYAPKEIDWNDPDLLSGSPLSLDRMAAGTMLLRYPENVLLQLDALLKQAEAKSGKNWQLELVRMELDYLLHTARSINALKKFRSTLSASDWKKVEKHLLDRQDLLDGLPWYKKQYAMKNGQALFGYAPYQTLQAGGRLRGVLYAPFNWDIRYLVQKNIQAAGRRMKVNDPLPQYMIPGNYLVDMAPIHKKQSVKFFCKQEKDVLKFIFIQENASYEAMRQNQISVLLGPDKNSLVRFHGRFRNGQAGRYVKTLDNRANKGNGDVYVRKGDGGRVTVPAPGVKLAPGEISAELAVPLSLFEKMPRKGDTWLLNATAEFTHPGVNCYLIWEHNFEQNTWRNTRDTQGQLNF